MTSVATQSLLQESTLSVATPEIDARIEFQKKNLDGLLQRFTEQHPDIVSARKLIKELEDQKRKEVVELRKLAMMAPVSSGGTGASLASQEMARMLALQEGIFAGTSSGLNICAALEIGKQLGPGHTIVTVACDSGMKYLAGDLFQ